MDNTSVVRVAVLGAGGLGKAAAKTARPRTAGSRRWKPTPTTATTPSAS
jgi:hypothetical protein